MGSSRNRLDSFRKQQITIIGLGLTITQLAQNTKLNMTLRTLSLVLLTGIITVQVTYQNLLDQQLWKPQYSVL
jgi:hypothetical protein